MLVAKTSNDSNSPRSAGSTGKSPDDKKTKPKVPMFLKQGTKSKESVSPM